MYQAYFGFSAKPFQLTPDPNFFFGSKGHTRAMAFLEYGLHQKEGFIVITGEVGAGKTTLIRGLLREVEQRNIFPAQVVSTQVDADDLLRLVAQAFGISVRGDDKAVTLSQLELLFRSLRVEGRRALLIVDEAQNLSARAVEELRMLSNYQIGTEALLQSFLVGQPEFRLMMQRPEMRQLKQRVIASYHLGPLDSGETHQYIEHRLRHVGWSNSPTIDDRVFAKVHDFTGGIPRRINTTFDRLLLDCYLRGRQTIEAEDVDMVTLEISGELGSSGIDQTQTSHYSDAPPGNKDTVLTVGYSASEISLASRCAVLEARINKVEAELSGQRLATDLVLKLLDARVISGSESE